jgi:hypothetical protein
MARGRFRSWLRGARPVALVWGSVPREVLCSAFNSKGCVPDLNRQRKRNQRPKQERVRFI